MLRRIHGFFLVRTAENGSTTQRTFYDFCMHFVKNLPKGQGKHGKPVILFLDDHSSRWYVSSLLYLMSNNVFPFLLPSHTSIWTQPNDNCVNLCWLKILETAVSTLGMRNSRLSTTPQYFNIILRHAWKVFLQSERNELLTCMENNTTSTYKKTGLYPFNPNCEAWSTIFEPMRPFNKHCKETAKCEKVNNYEIVKNKEKTILTEEEKKTLKNGLPDDTNYIQAAYFHMQKTLGKW